MTALILIAIDLVAMAALVFGLCPARRADPSRSVTRVNVGVLAKSRYPCRLDSERGPRPRPLRCSLDHPTAFGSRSQTEIAYYFASLAISLLTGMSSAGGPPLLGGLIALILVAPGLR